MYNAFCFKKLSTICILQITYSDIIHIYFIVLYICLALRLIKSKMNVQWKIHIKILVINMFLKSCIHLPFQALFYELYDTKKFLVLFCTFIHSYKTDY